MKETKNLTFKNTSNGIYSWDRRDQSGGGRAFVGEMTRLFKNIISF